LALVVLGACGSNLPPHIAAQFGTPTPTPFLPGASLDDLSLSADSQITYADGLPNTGLGKSENTAPWGSYPAPIAESAVEIPPPANLLNQPEGQVNILIMGTDQRPGDSGYRTDVVMLLTLNQNDGRVSMTSFPRDLYVYVPGWRMDRINAAQARGGFETTSLMIEYNFGIQPDHWVLVNFDGFQQIIDSLGGVNVQVARSLTDEREGPGDFTVNAGSVLMDGETALWYVRSRGSSSDFDRTRRQQEVLQAIFWRFLSLDGLSRAPELYDTYKNTVTTDLGITDILPLLPLANQVRDGLSVERYAVGPNEVTPYVTSGGASVLLPKLEDVQRLMATAVGAQSSP
jgi:LCP family protein required for cell wall assembly